MIGAELSAENDGGVGFDFKVNEDAVNEKSEWAGSATWAGARFAVRADGDSRLEDSAYLYERS